MIAFSSSRDGNFEIYLMEQDGTNERRITTHTDEDRSPAWSPNGTKIAFVRNDEINIMDANGLNNKKVATPDLVAFDPTWSPDGKSLAFAAVGERTDRDIYTINLQTGEIRNISNNTISDDFDPAWSPDGETIAFTTGLNSSSYDIALIGPAGEDRRVITGNSSDVQPSWSPDGKMIAFSSYRDRSFDIYIMNSDGSNATRLTTSASPESYPAWSPDGQKILFTSVRNARSEQIYEVDTNGENLFRLTKANYKDTFPAVQPVKEPLKELLPILRENGRILYTSNATGAFYEIFMLGSGNNGSTGILSDANSVDSKPKWSPDGSKIAFVSTQPGFQEIVIVEANGSARTPISKSTAPFTGLDWSPDGTKIVFSKGDPAHSWIYIMNSDGTGVKRITEEVEPDTDPDWSPDGTKIAFTRLISEDNTEIFVTDLEGAIQKKITNNLAHDFNPRWSPEADQIAFVTDRDGNEEIYTMTPEGRTLRNISNSSSVDITPVWSPDGTKIVFVSDRLEDDYDIYIMDADGRNQERLTRQEGFETDPDFGPRRPDELPVDQPEETGGDLLPLNVTSSVLKPELPDTPANIIAGKKLGITATVENLAPDKAWKSVAIAQVRDVQGITVYIETLDGNILQDSKTEFGFNWTPDKPGNYEIRIFVVESGESPRVLADTLKSSVTVSGNLESPAA